MLRYGIKDFTLLFVLVISLVSLCYAEEYNRGKQFKHWSDLDGNGLDTRQDALLIQSLSLNDLHYVTLDAKGNKVLFGLWVCPYTGEVVTDPTKLDVDHIVPLKYAWEHGADKWNNIEREIFANDPINVLVTRDYINQAKGSNGPDKWLPPNISYHSIYVSKFIRICEQYKLSCEFEKFNDALRYSREQSKGIKQ